MVQNKNNFSVSRNSIILLSNFTIALYIFGYIIFFASGYQYGVDPNLLELNLKSSNYYSILTIGANFFILFIFRYLLDKYLPKILFLPVANKSFLNWLILSLPLLLINFYYLGNAADRFLAKEISNNILIVNLIYLSLAYHSWVILTCRNRFLIFLSSFSVIFTSLITFEREPLLICFFALLLRMLNSMSVRKLIISISLLFSFFISIFFTSKIISQVIYRDNVSNLSAIAIYSSKFGNPILKLSGDLSHKLILENLYLSDRFKPNYDPKRIFVPIQIERIFSKDGFRPKTNGKIATETYSSSTVKSRFSGLGFSVFLDFYITFGFTTLLILPLFLMYIFRYVCKSRVNFLMLVPTQVWLFKLMRSDLWPSFIPYFLIIMLSIIIKLFVKNNNSHSSKI